jgi:hypothetical protein
MAKLSRDELISKVTAYIGERNDDESIALLEDVSDSLVEDGEDWKAKYDELDASWRARYIERFSNIGPDKDTSEVIEVEQGSAAEDTDVEDEAEDTLTLEDVLKED